MKPPSTLPARAGLGWRTSSRVAAALLTTGLLGPVCATPGAEPAAAAPALIAWTGQQAQAAGVVTQMVAGSGNTSQQLTLQGTVELPPQATEVLSTPLAGVVQQVRVSTGQTVRAGEAIAHLHSAELVTWQRELLQAQAQAQLAESRLRRDEKLHAEGIIAELRLQDSRTQQQMAELALRERRQMLQWAGMRDAHNNLSADLTVRAASSGTVLEVLANPGQRLEAGMPLAKIARAGQLSIRLQASPEQARNLQIGDKFSLPDCKQTAKLVAIVPQVSADNQAVQLRADYSGQDGCLRVQQFVQATLQTRSTAPSSSAGSLSVPASAVVRHAGKAYVFVRTAQGFVPTAIQLAGEGSGAVQVRAGLKTGDDIAVRGIAALKGAWLGLGAGEQ